MTDIRARLDRALTANNATQERIARATAELDRARADADKVCDELLSIAVALDAPATTEPRPVLCPIEPQDRDMRDDLAAWITGQDAGPLAFDLGVYRCDRTLELTVHDTTIHGLTLDVTAPAPPDEITERNGVSARRHLLLRDCTNVTVDAYTCRGGNTHDDDGQPIDETGQADWDATRPFEHAICIEGGEHVTVTDLTADAVYGDGAYFRGVSHARLDGFTISRNGRQGIAIIDAHDLAILNGTIVHSRRSGIDLEPNHDDNVMADIEIGHVTIRSRLIPITRSSKGISRRVHIHDIDSSGTGGQILSLAGDVNHDWTVERWTETGMGGSPAPRIRAKNIDHLTLTDITAPCESRREMTGVALTRAGTVEMTRCRFPGAAHLVDAQGADVTITDCEPA